MYEILRYVNKQKIPFLRFRNFRGLEVVEKIGSFKYETPQLIA
jgi:hypothetical protein